MALIVVVAGILFLTEVGAGQPSDMVARLKSGDISVCADDSVDSSIGVIVDPEAYNRFTRNGNTLSRLWAVNATGVNKDIGEVSCEATFPPTGGRIQFTIRPALDEPGGYLTFVTHTPGSEEMGRWIAEHASRKNGKH